MRNNPAQFKIMDFGMQDDGDNLLTKEEFLSHFKGGYNDEMNELLWNAMDKTDTDQVKFMEIHRFVNKVKKPSKTPRRTSIHDANWLFEKLKAMQFVSLDTDQGGTIDRKEFHEQFAQSEVDDKVLDLVFDDIDANGDGDISVMEFTKWQHNFTKKKLSKWKTVCYASIYNISFFFFSLLFVFRFVFYVLCFVEKSFFFILCYFMSCMCIMYLCLNCVCM